jgi:hypothetical protein
MATAAQNRIETKFFTFDGGVDSGSAPDFILDNQVSQAINTTFRGGSPTCRPPYRRQRLVFDANQTKWDFQDGFFQGAGSLSTDGGDVYLVASIAGKLFKTDLRNSFQTSQVVIPGNQNAPNLQKAWFCQAEGTLIVQDTQSKPVFWDGAVCRRAADNEVPVGGPITYGQGRVWVGIRGAYVGGDIVYGDPIYGRNSVLRFTENQYLNEGGAFAVPRTDGDVTGLTFVAAQDAAQGVGGLMVSTSDGFYQFDAPTDREQWKNTTQPLQRFALLEYGSLSQESISLVNGDLFFRARDGIRSFKFARREFEGWGNTPISGEVDKPVSFDSEMLLGHASSVNFDNRLITTCLPTASERGVWHKGLAVLDFALISKMNRKLPPVWEGTWTGIRVLQILTVKVLGSKRCFAYALDADMRICLYEILKSGSFDNDSTRIEWSLTTREVSPEEQTLWQLNTGDVWLQDVTGTMSMEVTYRGDGEACWQPWHAWSECVRNCYASTTIPCNGWPQYYPASLPRRGLPVPEQTPDEYLKRPFRNAYSFQMRMKNRGKFTLNKARLVFQAMTEPNFGTIVPSASCP